MTLEEHRHRFGDQHLTHYLRAHLELGWGPRQLAQTFGCTPRRIRMVLKELGFTLLSQGRRPK